MKKENKVKLFLVDDDAVFLKALEIEFLYEGDFDVETYPTGELCIENLDKKPDVIILDYHLDGIDKSAMNGLTTLDQIKKIDLSIPIIMLSSQDQIDIAIQCIHHDAFDYVVKSETAFVRLRKILTTIFLYKRMKKELSWYMERM